jgi:hypothetical protein
MSDTKDLLAQSMTALDAERATSQATIAALQAQVTALQSKLDPWAAVDKGASLDVTAQVQALIDQGLPVPAGRYLIDPVVGLVAKRDLTLDTNAVLVAKPNSAPRYCVLRINDGVTVTGGQILGDRLSHTYTVGSTHEWGYGFRMGNGCTIDGLRVSQCTGDGVGPTGNDCILRNIVSTQNRRQGMSIFGVQNVKVYDSEFSFTGALNGQAGTAPMAGVDIEPDSGNALGIEFINCKFTDNQTAGLLLWTRSGTGSAISATATNCQFDRNANGINAKSLSGQPVALTVNGGSFDHDRSSAARIDAGAKLTIGNAKVIGLSSRYALQAVNGGVIAQSGMSYA